MIPNPLIIFWGQVFNFIYGISVSSESYSILLGLLVLFAPSLVIAAPAIFILSKRKSQNYLQAAAFIYVLIVVISVFTSLLLVAGLTDH